VARLAQLQAPGALQLAAVRPLPAAVKLAAVQAPSQADATPRVPGL
jgi:hypothetical protein